ncbi:glycosyltransferase family 2 protein [Legionella waltersii]|uniref:Glycosyl transferase n=1 Tax=Legionella waltersii TaxID=66969 RepID=A0A0W1ANE5_9GAMM|nr:glycosyltransferase family 2 protein [Legionella waltersii]KTD82776.1 glycosyl transferase [Legionella waltersii]SNV01251.1 bactoprenol glucosyl transferase; CPS-53 (KpLE1) prophage [Legionella waltersii]
MLTVNNTTDSLPKQKEIAVIIPAKDEAKNLPLLIQLFSEVIQEHPEQFEVLVIDDGSVDETPNVLESLKSQYPFLRSLRQRKSMGIANALRLGYQESNAKILVFYPADLQFNPLDLPSLVQPIIEGRSDIVTGFKKGKYQKAFVSTVYNKLSKRLFKLPVRDLNNVKAYRREIMETQPDRPDWHRYMVAVAVNDGFTVSEVPIPLYPRHEGQSKFGISRIPKGIFDMIAVWFELKHSQKPLLAFGVLGACMFFLATLFGFMLLISGQGTRPFWAIIQTSLSIGTLFFVTGILGEQIAALRAEQRELKRMIDGISQHKNTTE